MRLAQRVRAKAVRDAACGFFEPRPGRPARRAVLALGLTFVVASAGSAAMPRSGPAAPACTRPNAQVPAARLDLLARGFNLPGWLEGPSPTPPSLATLRNLRVLGFTHIRLPVAAEPVTPGFSSPQAIEQRLAELDRALDLLLAQGYAVTIDLAPGAGFARLVGAEPGRALSDLIRVWTTLAAREHDRPADRVYFELLNEPPMDAARWWAWLNRLIPAVRAVAPDRTLIVGPAPFQRYEALAAAAPLADENVVYAFHYYDPMVFTHQGLSWDRTSPLAQLSGVPFPAAKDDRRVAREIAALDSDGHAASAAALREAYAEGVGEADIERAFSRVAAWSAAHRRPVIVDEFGVLAGAAPAADRRAWIAAVRRAAERFCFGWTHWEFSQGFGFVDPRTGRADAGIVEALLGPIGKADATRR